MGRRLNGALLVTLGITFLVVASTFSPVVSFPPQPNPLTPRTSATTAAEPYRAGPPPPQQGSASSLPPASRPASNVTIPTPLEVQQTVVLANDSVIDGNFNVSIPQLSPLSAAYDPADGDVLVGAVIYTHVTQPDGPTLSSAKGYVCFVNPATNRVAKYESVGDYPLSLFYDPSNQDVFVSNASGSNVFVLNGSSGSVIASIPVGDDPRGFALDPSNGEVFISNYGSANLTVLDGTTLKSVKSVGVGGGFPQGLTYDSKNHAVYVANENGYLDEINATANSYVTNYSIGLDLDDAAFDSTNGVVYTTDTPADLLGAFDAAHPSVTYIPVGFDPSYLTFDPAVGEVFVSNDGGDNVTAVNTTTDTSVASIPVGISPLGLGYASVNGDIYVAGGSTFNVTAIDGATNGLSGTFLISTTPEGVALDTADHLLYVSDYWTGDILVLNETTFAPVATLTLPTYTYPLGLTYLPSTGDVYVATSGYFNVSIIAGATHTLISSPVAGGYPANSCLDPLNGDLYFSSYQGNLTALNPVTGATKANVQFPFGADWVACNTQLNAVYVPTYSDPSVPGNLTVINGADNRILTNVSVGLGPVAAAYDPADGDVYVANYVNNTVSVVNGSTNTLVGTVTVPGNGSFDEQIAYVPYDQEVYLESGDDLFAINTTYDSVVNTIEVGEEPQSLFFDSQTERGYLVNTASGTLTVLAPAPPTSILLQSFTAVPSTIPYGGSSELEVVASGGVGPLQYSYSSLPPGCTSRDVADLNCTPTKSGKFAISVNVTDGQGAYARATTTLVESPPPPALSILGFSATPASLALGGSTLLDANVTGGEPPLTYQYTGLPSGCVSANDSVLECTPSVTGTFTIQVNVSDRQPAYDTATTTLTVVPALTASIDFDSSRVGPAPLAVAMSGSASGGFPPYSYAWDFGDASLNGTGPSVTHSYKTARNETVTLLVTDAKGDHVLASGGVRVTSPSGFQASILFHSVNVGHAPITVSMQAMVQGGTGPYAYAWSFGDGESSSGSSVVSHTYGALPPACSALRCGYTVTLTVQDATGLAATTTSQVVLLASSAPTFAVTLNDTPATGTAPLPVSFAATASGGEAPYSYVWNFGDGNSGTGSSPSHLYTLAGTYTVLVTATDANGSIAQVSATIVVNPSPGTNVPGALSIVISASPATGPAPLTTQLAATISGGRAPYTVKWFFGDGSSTPNETTVSHTYAAGSYAAILAVTDAAGDHATTAVFVEAIGAGNENTSLTAFVSVLSMTGISPFVVTCAPSVIGGFPPYVMAWNFGDGSPIVNETTLAPINHTYLKAGMFFPNMTVTDAKGDSHTWSSDKPGAPMAVQVSPASSTGGGSSFPAWVIYATLGVVVASLVTALIIGKRKVIFR